jgi:hypothetical protein
MMAATMVTTAMMIAPMMAATVVPATAMVTAAAVDAGFHSEMTLRLTRPGFERGAEAGHRYSIALSPTERHDLGGLCRHAISRPCFHELAPLLKKVAAPVGCFYLVGDRMSQRSLTYFTRKIGAFGRPIAKRGTETVHRRVPYPHAAHYSPKGSHRQTLAGMSGARENKVSVAEFMHYLNDSKRSL